LGFLASASLGLSWFGGAWVVMLSAAEA
jgi:hypothetical protein